MIYAQDTDINIEVETFKKLYLLQDSDTKNNNFILFEDNIYWHQIYIDCSVIFIQPLDIDDLYSYMAELPCSPLFEIEFNSNAKIKFHSKNSLLTIENSQIKIDFPVVNDLFGQATLKLKEQQISKHNLHR